MLTVLELGTQTILALALQRSALPCMVGIYFRSINKQDTMRDRSRTQPEPRLAYLTEHCPFSSTLKEGPSQGCGTVTSQVLSPSGSLATLPSTPHFTWTGIQVNRVSSHSISFSSQSAQWFFLGMKRRK